MDKRKKEAIKNGIVLWIVLITAGVLFFNWIFNKIKYTDTRDNRAFTYTIKKSKYSSKDIHIIQKGNLLPSIEELYSVAKKESKDSFGHAEFYLSYNGKNYNFASSMSCGQDVYVKLHPDHDFMNEKFYEISYPDKYAQYPDEETVKKAERQERADTEEIISYRIKREICAQYSELQTFRFDKDFHKMGFGQGGKYYKWLQKSKSIRSEADRTLHERKYIDLRAATDHLMQIATDYMNNEGQETKYTRQMTGEIEKIIGYESYLDEIEKIDQKRKN